MQQTAGRAIIRTSWASNVVFAVTALPLVAGADGLRSAAIVTALVLFAASLVVWVWAFAAAVRRSAEGDNIVVSNLFLIEGDAPRAVRAHLYGSFGVCLAITALTASSDPFGVLVPMLPLGLVGLWGARHGVFPSRSGTLVPDPPLRPERNGSTRGVSGGRAGE